ncbi:hypothetical protein [Bacillus bingmayongensis]|uniref:hypothetical protein n=1 Tax=Bacillus bingmayongensis TaxID=1150157 RepID=UPI000310D0FC|nr:hypothetical protein [Bacillus bingmayongensis]MBY0596396.1 hypothetical protein [Bacillus bingmayongensis]
MIKLYSKPTLEALKQFFEEQKELIKLSSNEKKIQHFIEGITALGFAHKKIEPSDYQFKIQLSLENKHLGISMPLNDGVDESLDNQLCLV